MNENEVRKPKKHSRIGTATKLYFLAAGIVAIITFLSLFLSSVFQTVSLETSQKILENIIQLDGVLFGFTATMLALFYYKEKEHRIKVLTILAFIVTAFLSYLFSIFMSFSLLMQGTTSFQIFVPAILTCFGGLCSSVYIVMAIVRKTERKE
jgi:ABC-type multidrug transport system fused ATPase/permease subunit